MSLPSRFLGFQLDEVVQALPAHIQVYLVGGAVRDHLMGRPVHDRDWVVVGAGVEDMVRAGFMPVGADFPVFLHPNTKEEYALARTERKSGHGYKGFTFHADPSVRLEEDLARRDFTINAMAFDAGGALIDPYGGLADLTAQTFRHVSPAFVEDPLRVLRLARFLARFLGFHVHPETLALCQALRDSGELSHLVPERVFAELNRGFGEEQPSRMLMLFAQLDVWPCLLPSAFVPFAVFSPQQLAVFDQLAEVWARWVYGLGCCMPETQIALLAQALRMPSDLTALAQVVARIVRAVREDALSAETLSGLLSEIDLYRKPERAQRAVQLLSQVMGDNHWFGVIGVGVRELNNDTFKQGLRHYLSQQQDRQQVAEHVQAFKLHWVCKLIATWTQNGSKNRDN